MAGPQYEHCVDVLASLRGFEAIERAKIRSAPKSVFLLGFRQGTIWVVFQAHPVPCSHGSRNPFSAATLRHRRLIGDSDWSCYTKCLIQESFCLTHISCTHGHPI